MAIEKERKFLLNNDKVQNFGYGKVIQQGYIMLADGQELRVRIMESDDMLPFCYICYKQKISISERYEFEYEIPQDDAEKLLSLAKYSLTKMRFKTTFNDNNVDIDLYPDGLGVVEIEFEGELTELPPYCGEDITGMWEYSNIEIAKKQTELRSNGK